MRLCRLIGAAHGGERIALPDQARKLRQRVALALCGLMQIIAAVIVVVRGKRFVLISISHRDDASPLGKLPTRPYKRASPRQLPSQIPIHVSGLSPNLPHLVRSVNAENGEPRCQNRDDALDHGQPRLRDLCIISYNEA